MIINEEVKKVIEDSAFITIVSTNADGSPHPIIVGKGEVKGDTVVFGIYKMIQTQKNIQANNNVSIVVGTKNGGPKGYRLMGTATAAEKQFLFTAQKAEALI